MSAEKLIITQRVKILLRPAVLVNLLFLSSIWVGARLYGLFTEGMVSGSEMKVPM